MASISYPRLNETVSELAYERLVAPQAPDGLLGSPSSEPLVYANGVGDRTVWLRANRRALVRGFIWDSGPSDIPIQLPANTSGMNRTDLIVLRLDRSTWQVKEQFIQGTPGSGAPQWSTNDGDIGFYDLPVASVTVPNNAAGLAADAVTPLGWYVNDDGLIVCTSSTRPPGAVGRIIHEINTDRWLMSPGVGERWVPVTFGIGGFVRLNFSSRTSHTVQVNFGYEFPRRPNVYTNIHSGAGETDQWHSRAINVTNTGFTLRLFRAAGTSGSSWTDRDVFWHALL